MVVAYRKATIALADEVVHLEDGRIVDRGTHAELLSRSPAYARLVNAYEHFEHPASTPSRSTSGGGGAPSMSRGYSEQPAPSIDSGEDIAAMETIRRGIAISPELTEGFRGTLALAVVASFGQVIVPIVVQQTLDRGLNGPRRPGRPVHGADGRVAAVAIGLTSWASYLMTRRLFTTSERGLATLRIKAFRHVHDLPLLTQNTERRGALVSRVTSDVDQVSQFLVFGGLFFIISAGQVLIATVVMVIYSWQLALVVWIALRAAVLVAALVPAQAVRGLRRGAAPDGRDARRDLRAGGRSCRGPLLRRRAAHAGPHRRGHRRVQGGEHDRAEVHGRLVLAGRHLGGAGQRRRHHRRHLARLRRRRSPPAPCSPSRSW